MHLFLCRGLTEVGEQALDPAEDIEVLRVDLAEALRRVQRNELVVDAASVAALLLGRGAAAGAGVSDETLYCTNHPHRETVLRCGKCGQPFCTELPGEHARRPALPGVRQLPPAPHLRGQAGTRPGRYGGGTRRGDRAGLSALRLRRRLFPLALALLRHRRGRGSQLGRQPQARAHACRW